MINKSVLCGRFLHLEFLIRLSAYYLKRTLSKLSAGNYGPFVYSLITIAREIEPVSCCIGTEKNAFLTFILVHFFIHVTPALVASTATAFAPTPQHPGSNFALCATANRAAPKALVTSKVDSTGNNIAVKNFLESAEATGLLTKVAKSGLLSKAAAAGITLSKLEPLIITASQKGILDEVLILTEAAGPDILPLLPTVVDLAPQALPLLALGLDIPPVVLQGAALASIGAAYGILTVVPDDTVAQVAAQTFAVAVLGVAAPVASLVGATILGKIRSL